MRVTNIWKNEEGNEWHLKVLTNNELLMSNVRFLVMNKKCGVLL